ncbi:DNA cytosine methyltransferase [Nocardia macrotermitis]|uniref:DNA (cytosine-5-)-methyltransferase n=1 Tax=Nocardia macrotermitis TaxID=2585198 RepID=A0A7K0DD84_9NOCA|nr:DNA (cytosine-5-)-methyltransferase [Nocardia macrotermitis]MQY23569.1 hypothetical protein [Nocardia macrotermitis]
MPNFYEFFAGGGMARAGLGDGWACLLANDIDPKKTKSYEQNWGASELHLGDVAELTLKELTRKLDTQRADLAWASFPCQDLSLAGSGAGLNGERSGTFRAFWKQIESLKTVGRAPKMVVLENVVGALTAGKNSEGKNDGRDFVELGRHLSDGNYRFGAVIVDAVHWVPQSRPRLFIIAIHESVPIPADLQVDTPSRYWHPKSLVTAHDRLGQALEEIDKRWIWWSLPAPPTQRPVFKNLEALIEKKDNPEGVSWHTSKETEALFRLMSETSKKKVSEAQLQTEDGSRQVATVYKRMRPEGEIVVIDGKSRRKNIQRAEVRFDNIAGCLRTPTGGSSRQTILVIQKGKVRSRLLSPLEVTRLMGLEDDYKKPDKYNDTYHLAGDGVVVDVVHFLAENILEPTLAAAETEPATLIA